MINLLSRRYRVGDAVYGDATVSVHRGHDQLLNRPVTIELLRPGLAASGAATALREKARRMALTVLPNVASLYDQGEEGGQPYLVLEELQGIPLDEAAPLGPDDIVALIGAVAATTRAAQRAQAPLPRLDAHAVRFADGRTQIVDWGVTPGDRPAMRDVEALAPLLALAATGSPAGQGPPAPAPLQRVVNRALAAAYPSSDALENELRMAVTTAESPTMAMPIVPPASPMPREIFDPRATQLLPAQEIQAPRAQPVRRTPARPTRPAPAPAPDRKPRRWLVPALAGLLLLGGLIAGRSLLGNSQQTAAAPATATSGAVSETAPPRAGATTTQGKPYVVAATGGQNLVVRDGPGVNFQRLGSLPTGTVVQVVEGPTRGGQYNWARIQSESLSGWCIFEALKPQ
jgi:serine/threonine-protein kinase